MIQVFRVFQTQNPHTFFLACSLMDRYFEAKQALQHCLVKQDLHLVGLVCVFISSKYLDVYPIRMRQILEEAGHNKYTQKQVLEAEKEFLKVLTFKI